MRDYAKERSDLLLIWLAKGLITQQELDNYPKNDFFLRLNGEELGFFLEDKTISLTEILKNDNKKLLYFSLFHDQVKRVMTVNNFTSQDLFALSIEEVDQLKRKIFPKPIIPNASENLTYNLFAARTPLQKKLDKGFVGFEKGQLDDVDDDIYGEDESPTP